METEKVPMRKVPVLDLSRCTDCESCMDLCPAVFRRNEEMGFMEIVDLPEYPEDEVEEVIAVCPADCIAWEEDQESYKNSAAGYRPRPGKESNAP